MYHTSLKIKRDYSPEKLYPVDILLTVHLNIFILILNNLMH